MSRFRSLLFPLALALILGGLSAWLGRISEVVIEEVKLDPAEPQYSMNNIQGRTFDESGSLKELLIAPKAWQLPDQKNIFLSEPKLQLLNEQQLQYSVNSEMARYELASKKVFFEKNVVLNKAANKKDPAARIKTSQLIVDTTTETAQTTAPVEYQYGLSHGVANGLIYNHKMGQLNLPKRVKVTIYDLK